jgi:hypothetical protein
MEWGSLVEKAKEGGFTSTLLPENEYTVAASVNKIRKSGQDPQLLVDFTVLEGAFAGDVVTDFLTFSDKAGGIAMQKVESAGGDDAFMQQFVANYGTKVTEAGVKYIADVLFDGKTFRIKATASKDGKNQNYFIQEVIGVQPVAAAPVAPASVAAPVAVTAPVPATPPVAAPVAVAPAVNPYAGAAPAPAVNPNLPPVV